MTNPQTISKEIQNLKHLDAIYNYGCCAFVFLWCLGIEPDDVKAIQLVDDAISQGIIDKECTVDWQAMGKWLTGRNIKVEFVSIKDISTIKERTPVKFAYKGNAHWVGVEKGMIAFNPLEYSRCVELGRPTEARIIKVV